MKNMLQKSVIAALLFFPVIASAAQFVNQPIFLSKSPATEGVKIRVYANVSNESATAFSGTVAISADGAKLGSATSVMAVGATQTVSVFWTPTAGSHVINAQLIADDGTVVQQVSQTFTVQAAPAATATPGVPGAVAAGASAALNGSTFQSSGGLQQTLDNVAPVVATSTKPIFAAIDTMRAAMANALNNQVDVAHHALASSSPTTSGTATSTPIRSSLWTIYLYILLVLRFMVDNAYIFYPVFIIGVLYALWKTFKIISQRPPEE